MYFRVKEAKILQKYKKRFPGTENGVTLLCVS